MKHKIVIVLLAIAIMAAGLYGLYDYTTREYVEKSDVVVQYNDEWNPLIAKVVNKKTFKLTVDGKQYNSADSTVYMDENRNIMMESVAVRDAFDCAVNFYKNSLLRVEKGTDIISMRADEKKIDINGVEAIVSSTAKIKDNKAYVPIDLMCSTLEYSYVWDGKTYHGTINNENSEKRTIPYSYSYLDVYRAPEVKNQGVFGTCWAFASLTALESALMPEEDMDLSEDHMSMNNSYNLSQFDGGDYNIATAYLVSWKGPVFEKDDPYGDGVTNSNLLPVKHVQEVQSIEGKDLDAVKKMVFKYGGVESAIYMAGDANNIQSTGFYNDDKNAYCYIGTDKPNHDVVIIGWDDNYPKENFTTELEGDGAFLCRNSWGNTFGDNGNFYVSYYDTNIAVHSVVYTKIEETDNYDNIYQSDLCGFVGLIGYGKEYAYVANVYTAKSDEVIEAVGMYATGKDTDYSIYVIPDFKDETSLNKRGEANASGSFSNAGYYTVNLEQSVKIEAGKEYAIVVRVNTPNSKRPIAIEYASNEITSNVDLSDGKGFISLRGIDWESTEEKHQCNVCLKVYTKNR